MGNSMKQRTTTLFLALALSGCANLSWQKADTDATRTVKDLDECQQKAMLAAHRLGSALGNPAPIIVGTPNGPVSVVMPSQNPAPDPFAQHSLLSQCMRERGYQLVRDK